MSNLTTFIREIQPEDNQAIEQIIRNCFYEYSLPLQGTAYEDEATKQMFENYQGDREVYFIMQYKSEVKGGGGIKPLKGFENDICEIQKLYFAPEIRGKGWGKEIVWACLRTAKAMGYKKCYLESASSLKEAVGLYEKLGFKTLDKQLGETGHFACGVFMILDLEEISVG